LGRIGEDVTIGRYVTSDSVRLGVSGLLAGLAVGLVWRGAGRTRWGAAPFLVAVLAAAGLTGRFDWPELSDPMVGTGVIVTTLAGAGAWRCLADRATHWEWVAAAALISAAGVWSGVPETGPALLAAGGLIGLVATAELTGASWAPAAGVGLAAILGWAALSGAAGRPWAAVGGALCTGVAPWLALRTRVPTPCGRWFEIPPPWLLGAHMALVLLGARWIGVNTHAGWGRVAIVVFAGMVVAMVTRR
jgi:hypothetical protein